MTCCPLIPFTFPSDLVVCSLTKSVSDHCSLGASSSIGTWYSPSQQTGYRLQITNTPHSAHQPKPKPQFMSGPSRFISSSLNPRHTIVNKHTPPHQTMRPSQRFIQYSRTIRSRLFNHRNGFIGTSQRRWQSSDAQGAATAEAVRQGGFARLWNSPVGVKTVHFWYGGHFCF